MNASSEQVLEWLVRADTASAFNISLGDVSVTGVQQVCHANNAVVSFGFYGAFLYLRHSLSPCSFIAANWRPDTIITQANETHSNDWHTVHHCLGPHTDDVN